MGKTTFTREQVYELVWSDSLAAISRVYNISYASLRDICKDMGIPIPPNGYWSKLKFGKEVYKERLFPSSGEFQEITLWLRSDEEGEEYFSKDASTFNRSMANITLKLTLQKGSKKQHSEVDPLVTRTREKFVQESKRNWDFKPNGPILDISVSKELQERALNLMNRFIQMMRACGHDIIVKGGTTCAVIEKEELALSLFEKSNRIVVKSGSWDTSVLRHNGKLSLRYIDIYLRNEWVDTSVLLEDKLVDIIAKLEVIAENNRIERERRDRYWEEYRLKEQMQKELQARKEKELSDFKLMFRHAGRYQKAIELRNYINTFEEHSRKSNTLTEEVEEWIIWARKKADWYDPFIESEDELLSDVNRETLTF